MACDRIEAVLAVKLLKNKARGIVTHHGDLMALKASSLNGCWLCHVVLEELATAMEDKEQSPFLNDPSDLRGVGRRLLWFANNTRTSTGYLDDFKGLSE